MKGRQWRKIEGHGKSETNGGFEEVAEWGVIDSKEKHGLHSFLHLL